MLSVLISELQEVDEDWQAETLQPLILSTKALHSFPKIKPTKALHSFPKLKSSILHRKS